LLHGGIRDKDRTIEPFDGHSKTIDDHRVREGLFRRPVVDLLVP
jgi:hypothetical protein